MIFELLGFELFELFERVSRIDLDLLFSDDLRSRINSLFCVDFMEGVGEGLRDDSRLSRVELSRSMLLLSDLKELATARLMLLPMGREDLSLDGHTCKEELDCSSATNTTSGNLANGTRNDAEFRHDQNLTFVRYKKYKNHDQKPISS